MDGWMNGCSCGNPFYLVVTKVELYENSYEKRHMTRKKNDNCKEHGINKELEMLEKKIGKNCDKEIKTK